MDTVKRYLLPVGTMGTLCSLSQLIKEGPATYAAAFRNAIDKLASNFDNALKVCHGIPVNTFTMESQAIRPWYAKLSSF